MVGTAHVYIPAFDMDIRGILMIKDGKSWRIQLPQKNAIYEKTKKLLGTPYLTSERSVEMSSL